MSPTPPYDEWFAVEHGLPHPIWWRICGWKRAEVAPENEEEFWIEFVRTWVRRLASALGPDYVVDESANFHLLSTLSSSKRGEALKFLERIREAIRSVLGKRIEPRGTVGKHLVLRFGREADYYRYVSHFHEDGESATSGGMCLGDSYVHVATFEQIHGGMRQVLVHELTHNLTLHLPNPSWLREGLAMFFESEIAGGAPVRSAVDLMDEHRRFWTPETIQQFWKGDSFFSLEGQQVSYSLADTLFRLIRTDVRPQPETFQRFVLAADWNDGGQAAAHDYLGIALEDVVAILLGPGDWQPKPETWNINQDESKTSAPEPGKPDENGFIWPDGLEPEPESK